MSCEDTPLLLLDRFKGLASAGDERALEAHLAGCANCRATAESLTRLWADMGDEHDQLDHAVPHERMRVRFHAALAAYEAPSRWPAWLALPGFGAMAPRVAFAATLLVAGVLIGQLWPSARNSEIAELRADVRTIGLALLDHQSASERLLGVAWAEREVGTEPQVVSALLERVENDSSVNVRLAAIEALRTRLDRPEVGAGLAAALESQDAPLLQVTLANALLESGDARSVAAVRRLHDREGLDPAVRDYLTTALQPGSAAVPPLPAI